jgi:hypothetical protein
MEKRFGLVSSPDKALTGASPFVHRNASKLSLSFFNRGRGDNWHRQTNATAADYYLVDSDYDINRNFPWTQLQQHTDLLLKKKGALNSQQKDDFLVALVRKHEAKDIAIAACGHAMSMQGLRQLILTDVNVNAQTEDANRLNLLYRVVLVAGHINTPAFSVGEVESARLLLSANGRTSSNNLTTAIPTLLAGAPVDNILYFHVLELARQDLTVFATSLTAFEFNCKWTLARSAVRWLSIFTAASSHIPREVLSLLHEVFPTWLAWAIWKPNPDRIIKWELFTEDQRSVLRNLLLLEGPDFARSTYGSLREAELRQDFQQPSHIPRVSSVLELRGVPLNDIDALVERVLNVIDTVCTNCPYNTSLVAHFFIGKTITQKAVELLESLNSIADPSISVSLMSHICVYQKED